MNYKRRKINAFLIPFGNVTKINFIIIAFLLAIFVCVPPNNLHQMKTAPPQLLKLFFCGTFLVLLLNGIPTESDNYFFHQIIFSP